MLLRLAGHRTLRVPVRLAALYRQRVAERIQRWRIDPHLADLIAEITSGLSSRSVRRIAVIVDRFSVGLLPPLRRKWRRSDGAGDLREKAPGF